LIKWCRIFFTSAASVMGNADRGPRRRLAPRRAKHAKKPVRHLAQHFRIQDALAEGHLRKLRVASDLDTMQSARRNEDYAPRQNESPLPFLRKPYGALSDDNELEVSGGNGRFTS
jgi:hypothetical protein